MKKVFLSLFCLFCLSSCGKDIKCELVKEGIPSVIGVDASLFELREDGICEYVQNFGEQTKVAEKGDQLKVHYRGWLLDGTEFDSSVESGKPFSVSLGFSSLIKGWDLVLEGMKENEKKVVIIPPEMAYGKIDKGIIPPNSTLIFEMELISITKPTEKERDPNLVSDCKLLKSELPKELNIDESKLTEDENGICYLEQKKGSGEKAKEGSRLSVNYKGWLMDGTKFDDSSILEKPFSFFYLKDGMIDGWNLALEGAMKGDKKTVIIPANLAYGPEQMMNIPPNADLIFEMEVVDVVYYEEINEMPVFDFANIDLIELENGVKYFDVEKGEGEEIKEGDDVILYVAGWIEDGTEIANNINPSYPTAFRIGGGQLLPGIDSGLLGAKKAAVRKLVVPGELEFGEAGYNMVPPNADLYYEIYILDIE